MADRSDYHDEVQRLQDERRKLRGLPKRPDRISTTEVLRAHLAKMLQPSGEHSTVRLARNARGDTQIEVSVRTGESGEVRTVEEAAHKAREVYDALALLYPPPPVVRKED